MRAGLYLLLNWLPLLLEGRDSNEHRGRVCAGGVQHWRAVGVSWRRDEHATRGANRTPTSSLPAIVLLFAAGKGSELMIGLALLLGECGSCPRSDSLRRCGRAVLTVFARSGMGAAVGIGRIDPPRAGAGRPAGLAPGAPQPGAPRGAADRRGVRTRRRDAQSRHHIGERLTPERRRCVAPASRAVGRGVLQVEEPPSSRRPARSRRCC